MSVKFWLHECFQVKINARRTMSYYNVDDDLCWNSTVISYYSLVFFVISSTVAMFML